MTLTGILDRTVRARTSSELSLGNGITIARTEWTRSRRTIGLSGTAQSALLAGLIGLSIAFGVGGFLLGLAIEDGTVSIPTGRLRAATTIVFVFLLWGIADRTPTQLADVERDHLFPVVTVRTVALGKVLFLFGRTAFPFTLPTVGFAIGFGLSTRSLALVVAIPAAVIGYIALALLVGGSLALLAHRLQTDHRTKRFLTLLTMAGGGIVWFVIFDASLAKALRVEWLQHIPSAWVVDLAFHGSEIGSTTINRAFGAVALTLVAIPAMIGLLPVLASRVWETNPSSASTRERTGASQSLVGDGFSHRVVGSYVSRSVLTIARKRWLQERRTLRSLVLVGAYLIPIPLTVGFFAGATVGGIRLLAPVLVAYLVASGIAVTFGLSPIATEYPTLPVTLTTVSGTKFVRGTILSGITIGAPIAAITGFGLGVVGPAGPGETLVLVAFGPVLCLCFLAIGVAMGMRVPYRRFKRTPLPLTNVAVYEERGLISLARMGAFLLLTSIVLTPAFVGYGPGVADAIAPALNAPVAAVRIGSLAATVVVAGLVSWFSYRHAVTAYNRYELR